MAAAGIKPLTSQLIDGHILSDIFCRWFSRNYAFLQTAPASVTAAVLRWRDTGKGNTHLSHGIQKQIRVCVKHVLWV